jgi:HEAT repeat protein
MGPSMLWSCPRCGEKSEPRIAICSRCGAHRGELSLLPGFEPPPPKACPSCGTEVAGPSTEGQFTCGVCGRRFPDYEGWVRECRVAAYAALRPGSSEAVEEPAVRPPHLTAMAAGLIALAPVYAGLAAFAGPPVFWACFALAILQVVSGIFLLREKRLAGRLVRLATGLSVLAPFPLSIPCLVLFESFSRPSFARYFGDRPDPVLPRVKHLMMGWLAAVSVVLVYVLGTVVPGALETARAWNEPLSPMLGAVSEVSSHVTPHRVKRCVELLMALGVLVYWARINRVGFLSVSSTALALLILVGGPAAVVPLRFDYTAQRATDLQGIRHAPTLLRALSDPEPMIRMAAARGLGTLGSESAVNAPALVHALDDPDRRVRLQAAAALARIDPRVEEAVRILKEEAARPEDRPTATRALALVGPAARSALWVLLENLAVEEESCSALAEIGLPAVPGCCEALAHRDPTVRRRAALALRRLGGLARSGVPVLTEALKDPDPGVRAEAIRALAEIQGTKAVPQLLPLLEDAAVSEAAGESLCALGERDGLGALKEGGAFLNALQRPALWDHLRRTQMEGDVEGTGREIIEKLAAKAALRVEMPPAGTLGPAEFQALSVFRRFHSRGERRPVLEILNSLGIEFLLESEKIRVLPTLQARRYWGTWLSNERGG